MWFINKITKAKYEIADTEVKLIAEIRANENLEEIKVPTPVKEEVKKEEVKAKPSTSKQVKGGK